MRVSEQKKPTLLMKYKYTPTRTVFYSLWILLFFLWILENVVFFLFAVGTPVIRIHGVNTTSNEQGRFLFYLLIFVICLAVAVAITVLFCEHPKNKVNPTNKNGHDNECMRGTASVRNINRHEEHTKEKPDG